MFARLLKRAYSNQPNITWDISLKHYKGAMLGRNFIGATHGDKGKNNYLAKYLDEFGFMLGTAQNRELFTGHLHSEMSKDLRRIRFSVKCRTASQPISGLMTGVVCS